MSNTLKRDYLVFIGRFQPFHKGHLEACQTALSNTNHLILLVGSALAAPDVRNPFSFHQREAMIRTALDDNGFKGRYTILPIRDFYNNDNLWIAEVQKLVNTVVSPNDTVGLFGHNKDATSYYLKLFPTWGEPVEHAPVEIMNATDVRRMILHQGITPFDIKELLPSVQTFLQTNFMGTPIHERLVQEYGAILENQAKYGKHTAVCTDAVVVCLGHILLVVRGGKIGNGLLALPGGHLEEHEKIKDGCIRELKEETRIKIPDPVLYGSITGKEVFDHPLRSARGRVITHAFKIELTRESNLPKVRGADDAKRALWMPLHEALSRPREFFEDHYSIIESFIGSGSVETAQLIK